MTAEMKAKMPQLDWNTQRLLGYEINTDNGKPPGQHCCTSSSIDLTCNIRALDAPFAHLKSPPKPYAHYVVMVQFVLVPTIRIS